jgi:histidinol-phosphatase
MSADLTLALELADEADRLSLARYRAHDLVVDTKPDLTPVTEADRAVERAIRARLGAERPGQDIVGEEFGGDRDIGGPTHASMQRPAARWIIDPIDGTKNYVRGVPVWATLLALELDGALQVAVVSAPALGRRWWAARGEGAHADGRRIGVSKVARVEDAFLAHGSFDGWAERGLEPSFLALAHRAWRTRGLGDFWQHLLVAEGAVDIALDPVVELWDVAPLQLIVEEAGGTLTDLAGVATAAGGSAVTTNGLLHDQVLAALGS